MAGSVEDSVADAEHDQVLVKKSEIQIEFLERLFSVNKYPNQKEIGDCASALNLTFNQVRLWFTKRRKEKRENGKTAKVRGSSRVKMKTNAKNRGEYAEEMTCQSQSKNYRVQKLMSIGMRQQGISVRKQIKGPANSVEDITLERSLNGMQVLLSKDYILKKIFRKDGPPLGVVFDSLPKKRLGDPFGFNNHLLACRSSKRIFERSQACESSPGNMHSSTKKHGIGKGLMSVWHVANADSEDGNQECINRNGASKGRLVSEKSSSAKVTKKKNMAGNMQRRKIVSSRQKKAVECNLGMQSSKFLEQSNSPDSLMDDEELELIDLQTWSSPPRCSAHIASKGRSCCPLCKDMLARFPPPSVRMKPPLSGNPWDSSPEIVKRFFKVLSFLYTHAVAIDICPFTLDELAQAFHDKDSMLLGRIHVGLLKLLLADVQKELTDGFFPRGSKDCRFLGFLHSVRQQELDVEFWSQSLNPLTWIEILRQVMISAGFASRKQSTRKDQGKKGSLLTKYGLKPRTLKGELFTILSEQGSSGARVNDLARASQIVGLELCTSRVELEAQIRCTLSSDCTLFEKIGCSSYRLRKGHASKDEMEDSDSDTECSGSVDYNDSAYSSSSSGGEDKLSGSESSSPPTRFHIKGKRRGQQIVQSIEIDESFPGAGWLLGLMEGEYSDLSIEEKLDALTALVDLTSSCSSLKVEEQLATIPKAWCRGSGGKIGKAQSVKKPLLSQHGLKCRGLSSVYGSHLQQAISLGWDRRYNGYWLFLGPCGFDDPGHRRVYFESSEDGHWEVIDSAQALSALISTLDGRGARESHLLKALRQRETCLMQSMESFMAEEAKSKDNCGMAHINPLDTDTSCGHSSSSPISDVDNNLPCEDTDSLPLGVVVPESGQCAEQRQQRWARAQAFDDWLWDDFYSNLNAIRFAQRQQCLDSLARCKACHDLFWRDEKHCNTCHVTFELDFDLEERFLIHAATCRPATASAGGSVSIFPLHRVLPSQLQVLKAAVHIIEACMSDEALVDTWRRSARKLWVNRLRRVSSMPELFQIMADFVGAIREDWLRKGGMRLDDDLTVVFQTMAQTTSAFALWLVKLDGLAAPHLQQLHSSSTASVKRKRGCL